MMMLPGKSELARLGHKMQGRRFLRDVRCVHDLQSVDTDSGRQDVAIGFLTCSLHLPLMMLVAKSFYHFSGIICPLYVWDDGSLTSRDRDEVWKVFPAARILRRSDLDLSPLARYPLISAFARQRLEKYESYAPALKLIGPLASPGAPERFILSDSDAFFFDWPQAIADWLDTAGNGNHYIAPWSGYDNVAEEDLQDLYARSPSRHVRESTAACYCSTVRFLIWTSWRKFSDFIEVGPTLGVSSKRSIAS